MTTNWKSNCEPYIISFLSGCIFFKKFYISYYTYYPFTSYYFPSYYTYEHYNIFHPMTFRLSDECSCDFAGVIVNQYCYLLQGSIHFFVHKAKPLCSGYHYLMASLFFYSLGRYKIWNSRVLQWTIIINSSTEEKVTHT